MEETSDYRELAQKLMDDIIAIGHAITPVVFNSVRGETAVLMSLYRAGGELSPTELGAETQVSSARVANILRTLEEKGLVTRHHLATDRRQVGVSLTEEGRTQATRIRAERVSAVEQYLCVLGLNDAHDLLRIARRTRDMLESRAEECDKEGLNACE